MKYFWSKSNFANKNVALISEDNQKYLYSDLDKLIEQFKYEFFNGSKQLIFIEACNNVGFISAYLACLRAGNPVLLLDKNLKPEFKTNLINIYSPNIYISFSSNNKRSVKLLTNHLHKFEKNLALLLSTSGSTGASKLVKLSKENIQSNASTIAQYLKMTSNDRAVTLMPLHYSYGLSVLNSHLTSQASIVLTDYSIISREIWEHIKRHDVTSISGVPFIYEMLKKLKFDRMALPSLRYLTQAGGKLNPELVDFFSKLCVLKNIPFYIMYGQTEASPRISYLNPNKILEKPNSIGNAISGGKLSIIDVNGKKINSTRVNGELVYEGPNVMLGYAENLEDLNKVEVITELKTGDIAYFDEDGDYYIVGRKTRFIKLYGLRFNLDQIESHLNKLGYQCVCGGDDDNLKVAVVNLNENENIIKKILISDYKINVKSILIFEIDEITRNQNDKIDYRNIFK